MRNSRRGVSLTSSGRKQGEGQISALFAFLSLAHLKTIQKSVVVNDSKYTFQDLPWNKIRKIWKTLLVNTVVYFNFFYFQNFMGLYMESALTLKTFSICMFINFTTLFLLQPIFSKKIAETKREKVLVLGFILMGFGMLTLSLGTVMSALAGTFIMTLGQMILFLKADLEVVQALPETPAIAFGTQRLCAGLGGLMSGFLGGFIFDYTQNLGRTSVFWVFVAVQCFVPAALIYMKGMKLWIPVSFRPLKQN